MTDDFRQGMMKAAEICRDIADAFRAEKRSIPANADIISCMRKVELCCKAFAVREAGIAILTACEDDGKGE